LTFVVNDRLENRLNKNMRRYVWASSISNDICKEYFHWWKCFPNEKKEKK